ncbi:HAMP domain-containing histidine kinase [Candidatus Kaiserbacteria bacterium]|nr:HAMP domain-containing histidine kinase [Candidatus Kaiserbacteria bacterium]
MMSGSQAKTKSTSEYEAELKAANEIVYKHSLELAQLTKQLELANREQESLLHFISHEVKGYLTESEAGFASIAEGDYGAIPEKLRTMSKEALANVRRGVSTVLEILDASNFKKGTVQYAKKPFDLRKAITEVVGELKPLAEEKDITINLDIEKGEYEFVGDEDKLRRHVLRNLIDNAIRYTLGGAINIELTDGKVLRFSVKDNGVGITPEDMKNLFTEGGHGKDSIKINVHSTGYGLFIAKQVVEAHGGKIWAESEGQGKGATFIVEFPTK